MEGLSSGMLVGITLGVILMGEVSLFITLLIPTIYYNYKFFKRISK